MWSFLAIAVIFFFLALQNSIGNVTEILSLLNKDKYTGEQITENYAMLVERWGEWNIVGADSAGLNIKYVDVGAALFSGFMVVFTVLTIVFLALSIVVGKILFPKLIKMYTDQNGQLVDLATLRTMEQVNKITGEKNTKKKKEWF